MPAVRVQMLRWLPLFVLLSGICAALVPVPQVVLAGPGPGWVKADVVGGGCDVNGNCSSETTPGSPTLYEYVPARESYAQGVGPGPQHSGYVTYESRDVCVINGVNYGLSAGTWHQGARWTLVARRNPDGSVSESWIGPSNRHWAFEHRDQCRPIGVATPTPTTVGSGDNTGNPGGGLTPTLPLPTNAPILPTPTDPPLPTVPPCYENLPTSLPIAIPGVSTWQPNDDLIPAGIWSASAGLPSWPASRQVSRVAPNQALTLSFDLSAVRGTERNENPLIPFLASAASRGQFAIGVIDLGLDPNSAADDATVIRIETQPRDANGGNLVVLGDDSDDWLLASGVEALGPQRWSRYEGNQRFFETTHQNTDDSRGDYAPPDDPMWPQITPDRSFINRTAINSVQPIGFRFTPIANHHYLVASMAGLWSCGRAYENWTLARFVAGEPVNVGITITAPRVTVPEAQLRYTLSYQNTTQTEGREIVVVADLPAGVELLDAEPAPVSQNGQRLTWQIPLLAGRNDALGRPSSGSIQLNTWVRADAPASLTARSAISMPNDDFSGDNLASATTQVITLPQPQADYRLRIHSDLDPQRGVYTSSGAAITWPANEVLDFLPGITLAPPAQPGDGSYTVSHRIVAWSFTQYGPTPVDSATCKERTQPTSGELEGASLYGMQGCVYRYLPNPAATDMRGMAHLFWSNTPGAMRSDVYTAPLPNGTTTLNLQYAVQTEARENGADLNGDGSTSSVLAQRTTIRSGATTVTLLVPRSTR